LTKHNIAVVGRALGKRAVAREAGRRALRLAETVAPNGLSRARDALTSTSVRRDMPITLPWPMSTLEHGAFVAAGWLVQGTGHAQRAAAPPCGGLNGAKVGAILSMR
jgi:hypothetical protein